MMTIPILKIEIAIILFRNFVSSLVENSKRQHKIKRSSKQDTQAKILRRNEGKDIPWGGVRTVWFSRATRKLRKRKKREKN